MLEKVNNPFAIVCVMAALVVAAYFYLQIFIPDIAAGNVR